MRFEEKALSKIALPLAVAVRYGDSRLSSTRLEDLDSFRAVRPGTGEAWCIGLSHGLAWCTSDQRSNGVYDGNQRILLIIQESFRQLLYTDTMPQVAQISQEHVVNILSVFDGSSAILNR